MDWVFNYSRRRQLQFYGELVLVHDVYVTRYSIPVMLYQHYLFCFFFQLFETWFLCADLAILELTF